jgi:hypothetical protein
MDHENSGVKSGLFVIEFDGEHSDPIVPLSPAHRALLEKTREMYVKAGRIPERPPTTTDSGSPSPAVDK